MTLSFGKFVGWDLRDVPDDYLQWLIERSQKELKLYEAEIERRRSAEAASLTMVEQIAAAGYRALAMKLHPDTGGTTRQFQELQAANEQLKEFLREISDSGVLRGN